MGARPFLPLAAALLLSALPLSASDGGSSSFCTVDEATGQMMSAADIDKERLLRDFRGAKTREDVDFAVRMIAESVIKEKLEKEYPDRVEIKWKDIYDVRGAVFMWACNEGLRPYCLTAGIDAIGSGLTGTAIGRKLMSGGLTLAGPPGFVMMTGMNLAEKTFQCDPDGLAMLIEAGGSAVAMLPWCKAPGVKSLCVKAQNFAGQGVTLLVFSRGKGGYLVGAARALDTEGGEIIKVAIESLVHKGKHAVTHAAAARVNGAVNPRARPIQSSVAPSVSDHAAGVPEPGAPAPADLP